MRKKTIYSILAKIEGLESINPDDENAGLPYEVIVDGYEFLITEKLEIIYQKTSNEVLPKIINIDKKTIDQDNIEITIVAKTEDKDGIEKVILIKNGVEVEEKEVTGKDIIQKFNITRNGTYQIKVVGKNKGIVTSEEIQILELLKLSGTLQAGTVIDGGVLFTITGQTEENIEKIEIYEQNNTTPIKEIIAEDIQINTSETDETIMNIEAECQIQNMPFYEQKKYTAKIIVNEEKQVSTNEITTINIDTIKTIADLETLATQVNEKNNTFKNKTINLKDNITTKQNWMPIGYMVSNWTGAYFEGIFNGNNHTVTITSVAPISDGKTGRRIIWNDNRWKSREFNSKWKCSF